MLCTKCNGLIDKEDLALCGCESALCNCKPPSTEAGDVDFTAILVATERNLHRPGERRRETFIKANILTNKSCQGANVLAKAVLQLAGFPQGTPCRCDIVGRVRDRVIAYNVREVDLRTFKVEFARTLRSIARTTGVELDTSDNMLEQVFGMIVRPQVPTRIHSAWELAKAIALVLRAPNRNVIDSIHANVEQLDRKDVDLQDLKSRLGRKLQHQGLRATAEQLDTIFHAIDAYRTRVNMQRRQTDTIRFKSRDILDADLPMTFFPTDERQRWFGNPTKTAMQTAFEQAAMPLLRRRRDLFPRVVPAEGIEELADIRVVWNGEDGYYPWDGTDRQLFVSSPQVS